MIISASRRTDIPAFYAEWFMNRIRAGTCSVPNPFNRQQVAQISLRPEDVEVIVFWTRHPRPLFPFLEELDQRGYRYYFQYTLLGYPRPLEPMGSDRQAAVATFQELATRVGAERLIWRYDPIVFSQITGVSYHAQAYAQIAESLAGYTRRSVVSVMDLYPKTRKRLEELNQRGAGVALDEVQPSGFEALMRSLALTAARCGMEIASCAEELGLAVYGIRPGKCIDDDYIRATFGLEVSHSKDPNQRRACGCVASKDIGMYDNCLFGCPYCYATGSFARARENYKQHDPNSPSLLGWYDRANERNKAEPVIPHLATGIIGN
jgi:hypothetical protein